MGKFSRWLQGSFTGKCQGNLIFSRKGNCQQILSYVGKMKFCKNVMEMSGNFTFHPDEARMFGLDLLYPQHTKYVGVYSFRFSVRLFVRTFVRTFVHSFIRSSFRHRVKVFALKFVRPHILKVYIGMMVDIGLKFLSAPSPPRGWPWGQGHGLRIFIKKSQGQSFFVKFIRPHILKTLWWISFIYGISTPASYFQRGGPPLVPSRAAPHALVFRPPCPLQLSCCLF